jgi:hypothetical protein
MPPAGRKLLDKNARYAGKRLLVIEDGYFLDDETAALLRDIGVVVTRTTYRDLDDLADQDFDGGVIDLAIESDHAFNLLEQLESRGIPHVFAVNEKAGQTTSRFSPYCLCADSDELMIILDNLFHSSKLL